MSSLIPCRSGLGCKGKGRPALLSSSNHSHRKSLETGYCFACRKTRGGETLGRRSEAPPVSGLFPSLPSDASARENGMMEADVIDSANLVLALEKRGVTSTTAALVMSIHLGENVVTPDFGRESVPSLAVAASFLGVDIRTINIGSLSPKALAETLGEDQRKRLVVVDGLRQADEQTVRALVEAMVTRRIESSRIGRGTVFAVLDSDVISVTDFPVDIILNSLCIPVGSNASLLEERKLARESRQRRLRGQLEAAERSADFGKANAIQNLLDKEGYVGSGQEDEFEDKGDVLEDAVDAYLSAANTVVSHEKFSFIFDVTAPEQSPFRRDLALKLLTGIAGSRKAKAALSLYERQFEGKYAGAPALEKLVSGEVDLDLCRERLRADAWYLASLARELCESKFAYEALKKDGPEARVVRGIYAAILERDPETALAISRKLPALIPDL